MDPIGIGLLGYGTIGKIHTLGYRELPLLYPGKLPDLRLAAVCTSSEETARTAAGQGGFEAGYSEAEELIAAAAVQVVDCCLPNSLHRGPLLAAIAAGKPVYCEKPLALNAAEAREIAAAARGRGVSLGVTFNFRFVPALLRARQMIEQGALGAVYSFRGEYLHTGYQDAQRPMSWRLRRETSGGGALVDLGAHVIDLVRHLLGEFESVRALTHTYVPERPVARGAERREAVSVDDAAWLEVRLAGGAIGTIEVSRVATGSLDDLNLTIHGERGALQFRLMDANWLYWFDAARASGPLGGERGWTRLETVQHYPGASIPPPRSIVGWARTHAENQYRFLRALAQGDTSYPDLTDGLRCQLILEAAYRSAAEGGWIEVETE